MLGTSQVQTHRVPPPSPFLYAKAGRNHLNEETTPLLSQGLTRDIAKQYQIKDIQHPCTDVNSPHKRKCWTNSGGPRVNSLLGVQTNQGSALQSYGIKNVMLVLVQYIYFNFFLKCFLRQTSIVHCSQACWADLLCQSWTFYSSGLLRLSCFLNYQTPE
jgi:hypothetical protein